MSSFLKEIYVKAGRKEGGKEGEREEGRRRGRVRGRWRINLHLLFHSLNGNKGRVGPGQNQQPESIWVSDISDRTKHLPLPPQAQ